MADGKVIIDTQVNSKGLKKGIDEVKASVDSFSVSAIAKFNLWGKAIDLAVDAIMNLIPNVLNAMDRVDKLSQKIGISAKAFQEWDYTLAQSGISIEGLQMGMKTLSDLLTSAKNGTKSARDSFDKLGLSWQSLIKMNPDDRLNAVIAALQKLKDPVLRTSLGVDLLGRSATELAPLLNTSAEATQALKDRAHELGLVLDDDVIASGVEAGDALQDLKKSGQGFMTRVLIPIIPLLTSLFNGLTKVLAPLGKLKSMFTLKDKTPELKNQLAAVNKEIAALKAGGESKSKSLWEVLGFGKRTNEQKLKDLEKLKASLEKTIGLNTKAAASQDELNDSVDTGSVKTANFANAWEEYQKRVGETIDEPAEKMDNFVEIIGLGVDGLKQGLEDLGQAMAEGGNPLKAFATTAVNTLSSIISAYADTILARGFLESDYSKVAQAATLKILAGSVKGLAGRFENGGIVGGNSYSGDKMLARVNSGELILNKAQQANIASQLTGASMQTNVNVENYAGADVSVSQNGTNIDILVEKKVLGMIGTRKFNNVMTGRYGVGLKGIKRG